MRRMARLFASIMVFALLVAACGGDEGGGSDGTTAEGGESPEGVTGADCALDEVDGDLNFYNWSEYMDPELVTAFEEQYSVDVVEDFYESNEALLAQMQAGAVYDLIVPFRLHGRHHDRYRAARPGQHHSRPQYGEPELRSSPSCPTTRDPSTPRPISTGPPVSGSTTRWSGRTSRAVGPCSSIRSSRRTSRAGSRC